MASVKGKGVGRGAESGGTLGAVVVAGAGVHVSGDNVRVQGPLFSTAEIKLTGSTQTLYCGAVGRSIQVSGGLFMLERGGPCAAS